MYLVLQKCRCWRHLITRSLTHRSRLQYYTIFPRKTQKCGEILQNRECLLKIFTILKFWTWNLNFIHTQATIYIRILNLRNLKNHYKFYVNAYSCRRHVMQIWINSWKLLMWRCARSRNSSRELRSTWADESECKVILNSIHLSQYQLLLFQLCNILFVN